MIMGLLLVPALAFSLTALPTSVSAIGGIKDGADAAKSDDQADSLFGADGIFKKITDTALFLIGAVSVVMLIYGGIRYTVSGGESGAVTNAKNTILYAIVGIVVSILAYAAVQFVVGQLV